jgi:hypothetical protein
VLKAPEFISRYGKDTSSNHPGQLWGPLNLTFNRYPVPLLGVKRSVQIFDHSAPSSSNDRNEWNCTSSSSVRLDSADRQITFRLFIICTSVRYRRKQNVVPCQIGGRPGNQLIVNKVEKSAQRSCKYSTPCQW